MPIIKKLSKMIKEEIEDAEKYANNALLYKDEDKALADTFFVLSKEELNHMHVLHDQVVRIINEYRKTGRTPPVGMQAIYEYLHEEQIHDVNKIQMLLNTYKS